MNNTKSLITNNKVTHDLDNDIVIDGSHDKDNDEITYDKDYDKVICDVNDI